MGNQFGGGGSSRYRPWALTCLVLSLSMAPPIRAYDENVHLDLTAFLLGRAGLKMESAMILAKADNDVDTLHSAVGLTPEYLVNRVMYHFVDPSQLAKLRNAAMRTCSVEDMGEFLHAFEDSYSHSGLGPILGQVMKPNADQVAPYFEKALTMAKDKFSVAIQIHDNCSSFVAVGVPPQTWDQIASRVIEILSTISKTETDGAKKQ